MKWLGPGYFGNIAPGEEMPKIDPKRLEKFIKAGKVGDIPEKIDPESIKSERIDDLEKENAKLKKENAKLKNKVKSFEKEIADLVKVSKKKDK